MPVTAMLDVTAHSPYYHDDLKMQLFYAEAWAMVHYMIFGPGMDHGNKLGAFFKLLQDEVDQQKAFRQVFGDPAAFDKGLSQYLRSFTFAAGVLPPDHGDDPKTFVEHKLSPAEADYELGCFHIGAHNRAAGRALIQQALTLDPQLAGAHEELGFLDFDDGNDEEAKNEWQQAVTLDPTRSRSLFALTMSGIPFARQTPAQLGASQMALRHITTLAPRFAPVYIELALIEWRFGYMQQAYEDAHQAETLEPWRAGYHTLTGRILLKGNQPALAAGYSCYVASHWFGPDHDEAVDLWEDVSQASRGEGPPLAMDMHKAPPSPAAHSPPSPATTRRAPTTSTLLWPRTKPPAPNPLPSPVTAAS